MDSALAEAIAGPSRGRLLRAMLAIAGVMLLFLVTYRTDELYNLEAAARDFQARILPPRQTDAIVLVTITDEDYKTLFDSRSPLDAGVLRRLVQAVAAGKPRVIAVDLDTSHESFRGLRSSETDAPAVVWGRAAITCGESDDRIAGSHPCTKGDLVPLAVLGGAPDGVISGLAVSPLDPEGTVRLYSRMFPTTEDPLPSFAYAVVKAYSRGPGVPASKSMEPRFISFRSRHLLNFSAGTILELSAGSASGYSGDRGVLRDRIVLLGGAYREGRDVHHTPLGEMSGIRIQAQTIATELDGGGEPRPSVVGVVALQFIVGCVLVLLFLQFPFRTASALVLVAFPILAAGGSLVTTGSVFAGLPYFIPLLVLIIVQQLYEQANIYREALLGEFYRQVRALPPSEDSVRPALERLESGLARLLQGMAAAMRAGMSRLRDRFHAMRLKLRRRKETRTPTAVPADPPEEAKAAEE